MSAPADESRRTGAALERTYQFIVWLAPTVAQYPRSHKFALGDRIQATALDVLEGLIEATYTKARDPLLARVNLGLEKLRLLFRLSVDLQCVDRRRYEFAARSLDEIGRQVGAWRKANRAAQA